MPDKSGPFSIPCIPHHKHRHTLREADIDTYANTRASLSGLEALQVITICCFLPGSSQQVSLKLTHFQGTYHVAALGPDIGVGKQGVIWPLLATHKVMHRI